MQVVAAVIGGKELQCPTDWPARVGGLVMCDVEGCLPETTLSTSAQLRQSRDELMREEPRPLSSSSSLPRSRIRSKQMYTCKSPERKSINRPCQGGETVLAEKVTLEPTESVCERGLRKSSM